MESKTAVVIGAGLVGAKASLALDKLGLNVIVIDRKEYHEVPYGSVRSLVDSRFFKSTITPHREWVTKMKRGKLIEGSVTEVDASENTVTVQGDEETEVKYDILVVASGCTYPLFRPHEEDNTIDARQSRIEEWSLAIKEASSVIVIGGGSVGCEHAAEIKYHHPKIDVTVVSPSGYLSRHPPKFRRKFAERMEKLGVKVIQDAVLNVDDFSMNKPAARNPPVSLKSGESLEADVVIVASGYGSLPNTSFLQNVVPLSSRGFVVVDATLQVKDNIFAVGDVADVEGERAFANWKPQPDILKNNVKSYLQGKPLKSKFKSSATFAPLVIAGPKQAVLGMSTSFIIGSPKFANIKTDFMQKGPGKY